MTKVSLRQLSEELTGIRLSAVTNSIWHIGSSIEERARLAINDGMRAYPMFVQVMHNSIVISGAELIAIPRNVIRVMELQVYANTASTPRAINNFRHLPSEHTNLIRLDATPPTSGVVRISGEARLMDFPEDAFFTTYAGTVMCTTVYPKIRSYWPAEGLAELTNVLGEREVIEYALTADGFSFLSRAVEGYAMPMASSVHIRISYTQDIPDDAMAVLGCAAESAMFRYWLGHRIDYDKYVVAAGLNQIEVQDLQRIVMANEQQAEMRWRRLKKSPAPGKAKRYDNA